MKVKTFRAATMPLALAKVKQDLGADAVILHTRTVKHGGVSGVIHPVAGPNHRKPRPQGFIAIGHHR